MTDLVAQYAQIMEKARATGDPQQVLFAQLTIGLYQALEAWWVMEEVRELSPDRVMNVVNQASISVVLSALRTITDNQDGSRNDMRFAMAAAINKLDVGLAYKQMVVLELEG